MSVLLLRFLPYIAGFLVVFGAGTWTGYKAAGPRYNRLASEYTAFQLAAAHNAAASHQAAEDALRRQIAERNATDTHNEQVIESLNHENNALAADRDHTNILVKRLLHRSTSGCTPGGSAVSQAPDQPGTAEASGASGDGQVESLLGDAYDEAQRNAARLNALVAQVKPQL